MLFLHTVVGFPRQYLQVAPPGWALAMRNPRLTLHCHRLGGTLSNANPCILGTEMLQTMCGQCFAEPKSVRTWISFREADESRRKKAFRKENIHQTCLSSVAILIH